MLLLLLASPGCRSVQPQSGGRASVTAGDQVVATVDQSQNPSAPTIQMIRRVREYVPQVVVREYPLVSQVPIPEVVQVATNVALVRALDEIRTEIGPSQQDKRGEIEARSKALSPLLWIGIALGVGGGVLMYLRWWTPGVLCMLWGAVYVVAYSVLPTISWHVWAGVGVSVLVLGAIILLILYAYHKGAFDQSKGDSA